MPRYLKFNVPSHLKYIKTKFRFGISGINTHYFRYRNHQANDLTCPLCKEDTENEMHFVLCCPFYNHVRQEFIPEKYYRYPCAFRLTLLLATTHENTVRRLSIYLYKAFKIRETILS